MERTLLIIKPDAVERNLIGFVISRLERTGFKILGLKLEQLTTEKAKQFYDSPEYKAVKELRQSSAYTEWVFVEGLSIEISNVFLA